MKTLILLLRGINVGGAHSLPMKELVAILEELGCRNVKTYIQSGNAVLDTRGRNLSTLEKRIAAAVGQRKGFEPAVVLLALEDLDRIIERNPFREGEAEPKTLLVGFLGETPRSPDIDSLGRLQGDEERFHLDGRAFYLHAPAGIGKSKLAGRAEALLGTPMTMRNWRTVVTLSRLAREGGRQAGSSGA